MKWMVHDQKKKELVFRLEEHEIIDEMNYTLNILSPKYPDAEIPAKVVVVGPSKVNSSWELKFKLPETIPFPSDFFVSGQHDSKGRCVVASGFSIGSEFSCHQAVTRLL